MTIRLSKFVGRDQLPGDEVAFDRINRLFARARAMQPVAKKAASARKGRTSTTAKAVAAPVRKAA